MRLLGALKSSIATARTAGNTFGVAKSVTLHAVRVLACDGTAMVSALLKVRPIPYKLRA